MSAGMHAAQGIFQGCWLDRSKASKTYMSAGTLGVQEYFMPIGWIA